MSNAGGRIRMIIGLVAGLLAPGVAVAEVEWLGLKAAYNKAKRDESKPLVLYLTKPSCPWCRKLESEVLASDEFNARAGDAYFAKADPRNDKKAGKLADSIKIAGYPTVAILRVTNGELTEVGKIGGFYGVESFMSQFDGWMKEFQGEAGAAKPEASPGEFSGEEEPATSGEGSGDGD